MFGKTIGVLALAASCVVSGGQLSLAGTQRTALLRLEDSAPWYQTDSGAAGNRANLAETVLSPSAVKHVGHLRRLGTPPHQDQCGGIVAPLLVGGDLYAITDMILSKYNARTGRLIWRRTPDKTFNTLYGSLAYSNGTLVVDGVICDDESTPNGSLWAYNAANGRLIWSSSFGEGLMHAVTQHGYVIAMGGDIGGFNVLVLKLSNGMTVWSGTGCAAPSLPSLVVGGLVMSYGCDSQGNSTLQASNLATGALVWSTPSGGWSLQRGDLASSAGRHLYVTNPSGKVESLNPQTGKTQYSLSGASTVLAVDTSRVYATCGSQGADICAYSLATGARQWRSTQPSLNGAAPLAAEADSVLYLNDGAALNAATGQIITQIFRTTTSPATALAVGNGRIAVVKPVPDALDLYGLPGY